MLKPENYSSRYPDILPVSETVGTDQNPICLNQANGKAVACVYSKPPPSAVVNAPPQPLSHAARPPKSRCTNGVKRVWFKIEKVAPHERVQVASLLICATEIPGNSKPTVYVASDGCVFLRRPAGGDKRLASIRARKLLFFGWSRTVIQKEV
jgi:hypothetical protein